MWDQSANVRYRNVSVREDLLCEVIFAPLECALPRLPSLPPSAPQLFFGQVALLEERKVRVKVRNRISVLKFPELDGIHVSVNYFWG